MTTYAGNESDASEKDIREQLGDLFSALSSNSARIFTPLAGVIVGVLAVIVVAGLYLQSFNALNRLNDQLTEARATLAVPGPELPPLDEQLIAWESALNNAIDARVEAPVDSEFVQTIIAAAVDTGVTLVTASAQRDTTVEVAGMEYGASPYLIRVSGDLTDVQSFLRKLESGLVQTLEVTSSIATQDTDGFLVSIGVIIRNELSVDDGPLDQGQNGAAEGSISVNSGVGR
jgi:Tfp pilus assembly protein PilN